MMEDSEFMGERGKDNGERSVVALARSIVSRKGADPQETSLLVVIRFIDIGCM